MYAAYEDEVKFVDRSRGGANGDSSRNGARPLADHAKARKSRKDRSERKASAREATSIPPVQKTYGTEAPGACSPANLTFAAPVADNK
jgi:hypothetical protein